LSDTGQESNLHHFMENIWLKRVAINKKDLMDIVNICVRLEDNTFVTLGLLNYSDGVYYAGKESIGKIDDISFLNYIEKITGVKKSADHTGSTKSASVKFDADFETICEEYKSTKNIKQTAKNLGLSDEKIMKTLITAGLYTNKKHKEIRELLEQGKTIDEISEQLKMSQKKINVYLPYSKKS